MNSKLTSFELILKSWTAYQRMLSWSEGLFWAEICTMHTKDWLTNNDTVSDITIGSEQLLFPVVKENTQVHNEEGMSDLVFKTLTTTLNGPNNCSLTALDKLGVRGVQRGVDAPESIGQLSYSSIHMLRFVAFVIALFETEQWNLVTERAKSVNSRGCFVAAEA